MKKIYAILICAILSSSCSLTVEQIFLIPADTPTPAFTSTNTLTALPTFTPVTPTLTFTQTPTLVGQRTATFTPESTPAPLLLSTSTPTIQMDGFISVFVSQREFYKGAKCQPASVEFTAQVANPNEAKFVALFVRLRSRNSGSTSDWTSITMQSIGAGTFVHELYSDEMKGVALFRNPWVEYQFVAVDANAREVGRTEIVKENLSMLDVCDATPTPAATGAKP